MSVAFIVGDTSYLIGSASLLNCFFSTIFVRLENRSWGARFPVLMNTLYAGRLPARDAAAALRELDAIKAEFGNLAPSEVVWDFEAPAARPPWGDNISPTITSMANYYVTPDGRDLLKVLRHALSHSHHAGAPIVIR